MLQRKIENENKEKLESLIKYRKEESKKRNYPAYYIFTNDQLEKIISNLPENMDELSNVLEPIKIKIYGNEILSIVKDNDNKQYLENKE